MKKGSLILFSLVFLAILSFSIYAQEANTVANLEEEVPDESVASEEEAEEEAIQDLIEEAQTFDEELGVGAGILPGSAFEFFDGFSESREEKVAEMEVLSRQCSEGDQEACSYLDVSFEKYIEYADEFEREVSPQEKEEAERTSQAIRGIMVREIAQNVDPTKKDELIRAVVQKEKDISDAVNIAAEIESLCTKLVELGEVEKAKEVCNLDEEGEAPEWLKDRRKEWKGEISDNAKRFIEILQACMKSSDDNILGNVKEECPCEEMPGKNEVLCTQISTLEDECHAGQEDSCGKSDAYMEEFMSALPEELRVAMESQFGEFEEEKYGGSPAQFEKEFRKRAPPQCVAALESGEIDLSKGMFEARSKCEKIMMKEFGDPQCAEEGLSPEDCAESMSSDFRGEPRRGHGIEFVDCEGFESNEEKLKCYRGNSKGAEFSGNYYDEKRDFGQRGGDFDDFDGKFMREHVNEYVDSEARHRKYQSYYDNPGEDRKRMEATYALEEACVRRCAELEKPWSFRNNKCECGESPRDYRDFERDQYQQGAPPNQGFQPPEGWNIEQGSPPPGWTPEQGFPPGFQPPNSGELFQSPPSSSGGETSSGGSGSGSTSGSSSSGETGGSSSGRGGESGSSGSIGGSTGGESGSGSTTTGGVIWSWGRITGNAFLDYHWYG